MRERLRVVFCVDNLEIGGTELNAVRTAERLDPSRFGMTVVSLQDSHGPLVARYKEAGIPVHSFAIGRLFGRRSLRQGMRLARFLRRNRSDVFHAHDIYSNIFGVPWARAAGVPAVIASRRWWLAEPRRGHRVANRLACRFAHVVLANCPSVAGLVRDGDGVEESRIAVVPNFLEEKAFERMAEAERRQTLERLGVPGGARIVGCVANLRPPKDHATLLRALASPALGDRVHLVLVGEGPCRPDLERLARELGVELRVHFAGRLSNDPNPHGLFEISVLASVSEACPNSVLEAMAAGSPVVATRVGGTGDVAVDGQTAILVPPGSPEAMAAAIGRLLEDPDAARHMGEAGRRRARKEFRASEAMGRLEGLYRRLTSGRAAESSRASWALRSRPLPTGRK
ncbi:MAG: glycosyltransferase [Gemmatimonadota bacterium]